MNVLRRWSVRHPRMLDRMYRLFERAMRGLRPVLRTIGYRRLETPVAWVEHGIKGLLFDCRMCGHCLLGETGMSCPMNCPKNLRNGPCGGVRPNGYCEVMPEMRCVWVEAWEGSKRLANEESMLRIQGPVDHRRRGASEWLRMARADDGSLGDGTGG